MEKDIYNSTAYHCSKVISKAYSTSFTLGIQTLDKRFHPHIYAIYGFVRYADEIVDTFYDYNQIELLKAFRNDTYKAITQKFSYNPVFHAFQATTNQFNITNDLIEAFLKSMEMDLYKSSYDHGGYEEYIYGSAEVVGLMCLKVFCEGDQKLFQKLEEPAKKLGSAFQKVNFLRDIKSDYQERGRIYFPGLEFNNFSKSLKDQIEEDIQNDFDIAYTGIVKLPPGAKLGVYLAYIYYLQLFKKIKNTTANTIKNKRIRIPDMRKMGLLVTSYFRYRFNYL